MVEQVYSYPRGADYVRPGDVLLVRNLSTAWLARITRLGIRIGAWLTGRPTQWTHAIVAHHVDAAGTYWGIEGRPGGVGWVDLAPHLADKVTLTNARQPKSDAQRDLVCGAALVLLVDHTAYDWAAIGIEAEIAIAAARHVDPLWKPGSEWGPGIPGAVICSALADWAYEQAGLETPDADRYCTPGDWATLIEDKGWSG